MAPCEQPTALHRNTAMEQPLEKLVYQICSHQCQCNQVSINSINAPNQWHAFQVASTHDERVPAATRGNELYTQQHLCHERQFSASRAVGYQPQIYHPSHADIPFSADGLSQSEHREDASVEDYRLCSLVYNHRYIDSYLDPIRISCSMERYENKRCKRDGRQNPMEIESLLGYINPNDTRKSCSRTDSKAGLTEQPKTLAIPIDTVYSVGEAELARNVKFNIGDLDPTNNTAALRLTTTLCGLEEVLARII